MNCEKFPNWLFVVGWALIISSTAAYLSGDIVFKKIVLIVTAVLAIAFLGWLFHRNNA